MSDIDPTLRDPNENWESGVQPQTPNAFMDYRDENGEDPLQGQQVIDNASLINTEWESLSDKKQMEEAIENAFRAVLLSPRKDLRWNTVHYQDLLDARSTDPTDLWRHLEQHRQDWNVRNFGEGARYSHRPYGKLLPEFRNIIYRMYKRKISPQQAEKKFERLLYEWETQEQDQVMREERDMPGKKQRLMYQIENEANKRLAQRIEKYIAERQTSMDEAEGFQHEAAQPPEQEQMFQLDPQTTEDIPPKLDRYGAFMGSHLKAIAKISFYVEDILKAALTDIHQHDGAGHHFRSVVLQLKVPGVGPKVCSFAWLLLQPLKSQLATIDTHMMDVLGRKYEGEMNNRDYFKFERELAARRDASGYGWVPLGAFQWGMWDYKRTGPGSHQDHSGLKVLQPQDYHTIDWQKKEKDLRGDEKWPEPPWWEQTKPAGEEVGKDYEENISPTVAQNQIPWEKLSGWRLSEVEPIPWFIHPYSGERLEGLPGETLMQHMRNTMHLSTPEIWKLVGEAGKA